MNRYKYLLETLLFVIAVLAFGVYKGDPAFISVTNHPFFLIILLISIRYGYRKGLVSTTILAATYLGFSVLPGDTSPSLESAWPFLQQPLFFFAFAMFVGLLIEVDKNKIQKIKRTLSEYKDKMNEKSKEISQILSINENISNQLVTADQSFNVVFHNTKQFYDEDIMVIYQTAFDLLIETVKATSAYLFILEGSHFKPLLPKGEEVAANLLIKSNRESIENIKNSHVFFRLDTTSFVSESTPGFVGPIIHEGSSKIFGLMVVKDIDFLNYNESRFITFKNLCKWLGEILYFRSNRFESVIPGEQSATSFNYIIPYGASKKMIHQKIEAFFGRNE